MKAPAGIGRRNPAKAVDWSVAQSSYKVGSLEGAANERSVSWLST